MNSHAIGIFDSGLGGLTAVRELKKLLPHEHIIYFGDNARVPYGGRSRQTIRRYAEQDIRFLLSHEVKMLVAACGTVSSNPPPKEFLESLPVAYTNVLMPAVQAACRQTKNGRIGVIATAASIHSGAYERQIHRLHPEMTVIQKACPLFVPLIENGYIQRDNAVTIQVARDYLEPILAEGNRHADSGLHPLSHHQGLAGGYCGAFGHAGGFRQGMRPRGETVSDRKRFTQSQHAARRTAVFCQR